MNQQKLKVLFISSWFPNKENPTLGNFVEKHLRAISMYCNVMVIHIAFSDSVKGKRYNFDFKEENDIPIFKIYISRKGLAISSLRGVIKFYYFVNAYIKGYRWMIKHYGKPDILHANILYPISWIALLFHYKFKLPYVLTEHWTAYLPQDPNKLKFFQLLLMRITAKKAKKITVVSSDLQKAMLSCQIKGNYEVIYNVVDNNVFKPILNKKTNSKVRFIHISSLDDAQKNVSGIIKAVYQLSLVRNDFELSVVGDGNAASFIQLARELNVYQSYVSFEESKKTEEIAILLQNADCLLMFSNFESFSVVIAESLACGIPVIATKSGGLANELSKEQGIFIMPNDLEALIAAMIEMIEHHQDFEKLQLADYASRFSYENIGKSFLDVYNKINKQ